MVPSCFSFVAISALYLRSMPLRVKNPAPANALLNSNFSVLSSANKRSRSAELPEIFPTNNTLKRSSTAWVSAAQSL